MGLGWARSKQGVYSTAAALLEEAIALFRDVGMKQLLAFASSLLAEVAYAQGEDGQAAVLLEDSVRLFRDIGDKYGLAMALHILGTVVHMQGDVTHATALHEESLPCVEPSGTSTASRVPGGLGRCRRGAAAPAPGGAALGAAEALRASLAPPSPREQASVARHVSTVRAGLGDAAFGAAWAAGQTTALHTSTSRSVSQSP